MITSLTKQQLAFLLDIKAEEARAKMCHAWTKSKGIENEAFVNDKNKVVDSYPLAMDVGMLSLHLNLPTLQEMVNDVEQNYLNRPASKKWILCDFPEKTMKTAKEAGKKLRVDIPPALRSMLPVKIQQLIKLEWQKRYSDQGLIL